MKLFPPIALTSLALASTLGVTAADDADNYRTPRRFEVTVTNLTRGQAFTPILVATHLKGLKLFTPGSPARPQLATLAEEGDTKPLADLLRSLPAVKEVAVSSGLTGPGKSTTITLTAGGRFDHFSVAAMLIPTNDGFFAINGLEGPMGPKPLSVRSPAYDAGSERNDELCASIPGPSFTECGGPGGGAKVGSGEGFVHIHAGIHGIGNFNAAERDWRNPVAEVTISPK